MAHKRHEETADITFADQKIIDIDMAKEVKQSFIEYSMSVITSRALPDVRDGMKPGQRRILYAMYEDHLTYDKPFRKSATTVGNVLGHYHPHGDAAVYGTMVRMAQPFSLRYPLIEGHGNFGNIDGDGAAAYRYTEARMSRLADEMLRDLNKNVVEMTRNFDNKLDEPTVLPSRFPNLLVNGSVGIAVGMATNIPTHNLGEVIDGTIHLMEHPEADVRELMQFIKGPDFPTSALIYGENGIIEAYTTGRGKITVRARAEVEEDKHRIIITEIPFQVQKSTLVESMAMLVRDKRIEGVTEIRDESSGKTGIRIVVEYRRDAMGQVILNQFYKYSQLQDTCAVNMLALVDGEPKILNLKQMLEHYIHHQESVIRRRTAFELDRARREAHIYEGYKIAIENIDEVVEIIRASATQAEAKAKLAERFSLTDVQAQAIVDMTLGRLCGMEREKIAAHLTELYAQIHELEDILANSWRIHDIIKTEMLAIKDRFADPRRTELVAAEDEIILEDLIERHTCVITMTHAGYIKRQPADTYSAQRRGGRGIIGMSTKEEDFIENVIVSNSHSHLLLFTSAGRVHMRKAYQIPEASRTAKGTNIVNILELEQGEKITAVLDIDGFNEEEYLVMVTKGGIVKRTPVTEYRQQRKGGKIAITLDEGDELLFVGHTDGTKDILIASRDGNAARFSENLVTIVGRSARGVRGIKLRDGDSVAGACVIDREETRSLITICEKGYGKRTAFDNFEPRSRGIQGVICHNVNDKTGALCGIAAVSDNEDLMLITNEGTIIRTPVTGIPVYGRNTAGVRVMRLADESSIVNFTSVEHEEAEEAEDTEVSSES